MDISKLTTRAVLREGGKEEINDPQARDFMRALQDQLLEDSGGDFDLYAILHSLREPDA